ncbi:hypothetical protein ACFSCV_14140 [Methylopila henanensis]|uniref:Uncharacterized protein n=1 Tax=Methylopila henanensis TaxID=873516 RepID=A0ABW4KBR6_9HYPH
MLAVLPLFALLVLILLQAFRAVEPRLLGVTRRPVLALVLRLLALLLTLLLALLLSLLALLLSLLLALLLGLFTLLLAFLLTLLLRLLTLLLALFAIRPFGAFRPLRTLGAFSPFGTFGSFGALRAFGTLGPLRTLGAFPSAAALLAASAALFTSAATFLTPAAAAWALFVGLRQNDRTIRRSAHVGECDRRRGQRQSGQRGARKEKKSGRFHHQPCVFPASSHSARRALFAPVDAVKFRRTAPSWWLFCVASELFDLGANLAQRYLTAIDQSRMQTLAPPNARTRHNVPSRFEGVGRNAAGFAHGLRFELDDLNAA